FTRLFSFSNGTNGSGAQAGLTLGKGRNFFCTNSSGGIFRCFGTFFRFSTNGTFTPLASFDGTNGGSNPEGPLVMDTNGNFYGTCPQGGSSFRGTVYRATTNGLLTTLVSFNPTNNGSAPRDGLIFGD